MLLRASSTDSGWKWKTSARIARLLVGGRGEVHPQRDAGGRVEPLRARPARRGVPRRSRRTKIAISRDPLAAAYVRERRLRRRQPRHRHAEGRAAHVVEPDLVEELDRRRVAAVLAADAELEVRLRRAALRHRDLHQLADAGLVDRRERVLLHDLVLGVGAAGTSPSRRATCRGVCVRSLVPKLKNSADCAISSAVSAPRGTSIIVPTR